MILGIICAALGAEEGVSGKFEVEDLCFAGLPDPIPRELPLNDK